MAGRNEETTDGASHKAAPRPGEKMNEQLLIESDIEGTRHKRVMRSQEGAEDWENLQKNLEALWEAVSQEDTRGTKALLRRICH